MSKISEKLNIINNAKNDIKTAIENKGVTVGDVGIQEYASKIDEMQIPAPVTKGLVINEYDSDGYAIDVSIVGMNSIPSYYCYYTFYQSSTYKNIFSRVRSNFHFPSDLIQIGTGAFQHCTTLELTELPSTLIYIGQYAFQNCGALAIKEIPSGVTELPGNSFRYCHDITELTCNGLIQTIGSYAFGNCSSLKKVVFPNITSVPTLSNTNAFTGTPIANGTGYFYIPDTLVTQMQSASNWSTYASQIKGVSEL